MYRRTSITSLELNTVQEVDESESDGLSGWGSLSAAPMLPDFPSTPEREHKYTSSFDELDGVDFPDDMLKRFSFSSSTSHVSSPARIEVPETNPKRKALPLRTRSEELPISPGCRRQLDSAKQEKRLYMLRQMAIYSQPPDTLAAKTRAAARRGRKCRRDRYNSAPEMPPTSPRSTASSSSSSSASDRRLKKLSFFRRQKSAPLLERKRTYSAGRVFRINPKFEYTPEDVRRIERGTVSCEAGSAWTRAHSHVIEGGVECFNAEEDVFYAHYNAM